MEPTETRIGDVASVGKRYVTTADAVQVATDQTGRLPADLAQRITALIAEHESAKTPDATIEAQCSRDADKLECLLQAREYQVQTGNQQLEPWVTSMVDAVRTGTGKALAAAALEVEPGEWWSTFAATFGRPRRE